ncbi:hypothetical protein E6H36_13315 [Candidatus Bathyarchaeota archaeon]|nr:MAG: hypothetical protein E6H32_05745 [Candidatus Bathyarchaeota archaeon]TMI19959.1 MAG: hypothetical protein E6H36_13315 [Candidatus Bathyarchaeota archaeon]
MNRRVITPLLIAVLSLMTVIPEAPSLLVHATGPAVVAVDPAISAADVGGSFTVSVTVNSVDMLVGYDVILNYDPSVVSCTAASFPVILPNNFPVGLHNFCSNGTGSAEAAAVSLGGSSASISSPTAVLVLTFTPLQASFATLQIALAQLAVLPGPTIAPVTTSDGTFGVPPSLTFIIPNATVAAGQRLSRISHGDTQVTLVGFVLMLSSNVRAGFGGVTFDVIDPNGVDTPIQSNIAFGFPGDSLTVTATYTFDTSGFAIGTYHIVATVLRCTTSDPSTCVNGQTLTGLFFKLKS